MNPESVSPILVLGIIGSVVFYGRFLVQWVVSEVRKQSVMPTVFWYMSAVGSVMLLSFGILNQSLLGTLGQNLNVVIYGRNITHIWREREVLTPTRKTFLNLFMVGAATVGMCAVGWLAWREWQGYGEQSAAETREAVGWLILGLLGQALFAARFILQWVATERAKRSVVPRAFWFLSFFAASFQSVAFLQRDQMVFAVGMAFTVFIYARNIWFIYRDDTETQTE